MMPRAPGSQVIGLWCRRRTPAGEEGCLNQGGGPFYTVRGARPRPVPAGSSARSSWWGPLVLTAVMLGWMLFIFALAAFAAPENGSGTGPVELGQGVTVSPAGGWTSAADVWQVGPNALSLQRAGVLVAFAAEVYEGTTDGLLAGQSAELEGQFDSYRALPPSASLIAGDVPALTVLFSGTADSSRLEGELVAATSGGTGVVMLAIAPAGQLPRVQADIDAMLETMVVPR